MIGKIVELAQAGKHAREIAEQLALTQSYVRRIAKKNGFALPRPPSDGKANFRHGHCPYRQRPSAEYTAWTSMKTRCLNPHTKKYKYYGGRGITIAPEWMRFENFFADMGKRPSSKHTLEREKVNEGYSKENCCWATRTAQSRNRRFTKLTMGTAILMRKMYASGLFTQKELAIEFDISKGHVPAILNGGCWQ